MKKIMFFMATIGILSLGVFFAIRNSVQSKNDTSFSSQVVQTSLVHKCTLDIKGMDSAGCARVIRHSLTRLDGVQEAEINYNAATALVQFDPNKVSAKRIIQSVEKAGFGASLVATNPSIMVE